MDSLSGQRRGRQRAPDSRAARGGLFAGIGHQPDHGGEDRERELKIVFCAAAAAALAAGCGTTAAPAPADLALGERAFQKCYSCHALEPGAAKLDGPTLHGIVGRRVAAVASFEYSPALRQFAQRHPRWTPELLDRYVADPEALVPGTSMTFHGVVDGGERRALIEYLAQAGR